MSPRLPLIFIFDMDATLIGDRVPYSKAQGLRRHLQQSCLTGKVTLDIPLCKKPLDKRFYDAEEIDDRFFRPFLKEALTSIKTMTQGDAEFFIFTAGAYVYGIEMVNIIEKKIGITFNRPMLSYDNLSLNAVNNQYEKSILLNFDTYIKSLIGRYPALKNPANVEIVKQGRIIFLDDSNWTEEASRSKFIHNISYDFCPIFDPLADIPVAIRAQPIVKEMLASSLSQLSGKYFIEPEEPMPIEQRNMLYHVFMADLYRMAIDKQAKAEKDMFFFHFIKAIKPYINNKLPFSDKTVPKICAYLKKKEVLAS